MEPARRAARRAPHRPLGAHALRGAGRHLGRSSATRICRTTCSTAQPAGTADRRAAPPFAGDRKAAAAERRTGARRQGCAVARGRPGCGRSFRARVRRHDRSARACPARAVASDAPGQHRLRRPRARLARHRCDRLARRISVRRALPGHRGGGPGPGARLHRARADASSRAAAAPATPAARCRSTGARR